MHARLRSTPGSLVITLLLAGLASASPTGGADACATPLAIAGQGVFPFDLTTATTGAVGQNEPYCSALGNAAIQDDVWFLWTAGASGLATLDTCGGQTGVDTKLAVYPGGACPVDGSALACGDDECGFQSAAAWSVVSGAQYLIQLGRSPFGASGSGTFTLAIGPPGATAASYSAGTPGNPAVTQAPTAQGWTDVDLSLGQIAALGLSPDGATGFNAWQLAEANPVFSGNPRFYLDLLTGPELAIARQVGWELDVRMRLLPSFLAGSFFEFATGQGPSDLVYRVELQAVAPDVRVFIGSAPTIYLCPGAMDGNHHQFTLRRGVGPLLSDAAFYYDGVLMGLAPPGPGDPQAAEGGVRFGKTSSTMVSGSNWNEVRFAIGPEQAGTAYCFGDGGGTPCPCGNAAPAPTGCANSSGAGAWLFANGGESLAEDDLAFTCRALLPAQPSLLFVGFNAVNGGDGVSFGDGLRCAGMNVQRLGVRAPDAAGVASWGPGLAAQAGWVPGDLRRFQVWYRDPAGGGACGNGFNLSNGLELTFLP